MRRVAITLALALALGSCSDDGRGGFGPDLQPSPTEPSPTPTPEEATGEGRRIELAAPGGFRFDVSELSLPRGERVTFVFRNADGQRHTFTLDELNVQMVPEAGETVRLSVTIPDYLEGTYAFYCAIPGHRAAGMEGTAIIG